MTRPRSRPPLSFDVVTAALTPTKISVSKPASCITVVQTAQQQGQIDGATADTLTRAILADTIADNVHNLVNDFFTRRR